MAPTRDVATSVSDLSPLMDTPAYRFVRNRCSRGPGRQDTPHPAAAAASARISHAAAYGARRRVSILASAARKRAAWPALPSPVPTLGSSPRYSPVGPIYTHGPPTVSSFYLSETLGSKDTPPTVKQEPPTPEYIRTPVAEIIADLFPDEDLMVSDEDEHDLQDCDVPWMNANLCRDLFYVIWHMLPNVERERWDKWMPHEERDSGVYRPEQFARIMATVVPRVSEREGRWAAKQLITMIDAYVPDECLRGSECLLASYQVWPGTLRAGNKFNSVILLDRLINYILS